MNKEVLQLNILQNAALLSVIPLYFLPSVTAWHWISVILCYTIFYLSATVGYHRLVTHRSFTTYKWVEYLLVFLGGLGLQSSMIAWKAMHLNHHRYTDKEGDSHSPEEHGILNCMFNTALVMNSCTPRETQKRIITHSKNEIRDRFYSWQHKNYMTIIGVVVIILALIDIKWALVYLLGAGLSKLGMGVIASISHRGGKPRTDWWLVPFVFGEALHEQHHRKPKEAIWSNFDLGSWLIRFIRT